jgi:hypothetical protein
MPRARFYILYAVNTASVENANLSGLVGERNRNGELSS